MESQAVVRRSFPHDLHTPAAARRLVAATLADWGLELLADDAALLVSELATNAVRHAGTDIEVSCRQEADAGRDGGECAVRIEVQDRRPDLPVVLPQPPPLLVPPPPRALPPSPPPQSSPSSLSTSLPSSSAEAFDGSRGLDDEFGPLDEFEAFEAFGLDEAAEAGYGDDADDTGGPHDAVEPRSGGYGLGLIGVLAGSWGVTYEKGTKCVWFRLPHPRLDGAGGTGRGTGLPSSAELERQRRGWVAFLAEASELFTGLTDEDQVAALATQLLVPRIATWAAVFLDGHEGARLAHCWHTDEARVHPLRRELRRMVRPALEADRWAWPSELDGGARGQAVAAFPIEFDSTVFGTLAVARQGAAVLSPELVGLVWDLCRRLGLALHTARQYSKIARISGLLQRSLKPLSECPVPGIDCSVVYEPVGEGVEAGGDFYDIFRSGPARWGFMLGDVCGSGPEAAVATGLARHAVRLFAREQNGPAEVLDRLNRAILAEGEEGRLTSLVHGRLSPLPGGGSRCEICCAGHVLPLVLSPDGRTESPCSPQLLLGVHEEPGYFTESFDLAPGQSLICVTDGVTECRRGGTLLDDDNGLIRILSRCERRTAAGIAAHITNALAEFSAAPRQDDVAILVMTAGAATTASAPSAEAAVHMRVPSLEAALRAGGPSAGIEAVAPAGARASSSAKARR